MTWRENTFGSRQGREVERNKKRKKEKEKKENRFFVDSRIDLSSISPSSVKKKKEKKGLKLKVVWNAKKTDYR